MRLTLGVGRQREGNFVLHLISMMLAFRIGGTRPTFTAKQHIPDVYADVGG
jgi:hypothetical protein